MFDRKKLLTVNWDEIIFDLILVVYAEFFLYRFIAGGGWLVHIVSVNLLFSIGVLVDFFLIWYIGIIFVHFKRATGNYFVLGGIALLSLWIVLSLHFGLAFNIMDISGDRDIFTLAIFGYLLVMAGIGGGIVFGLTEQKRSRGEPVMPDRMNALKKLVPAGMVAMNAYIAYHILDALHLKRVLPGIALWIVLTFLEYFIFSLLEKWSRKRQDKAPAGREIFRKFIFPFIIITILCFWDEIYIWGKIQPALQSGSPVSAASMIIYLFFAGIIPMRILIALKPPITIINIATGIASIAYFVYSIISLLRGIFH